MGQSRTRPGFYVEGINAHNSEDSDHSEDDDDHDHDVSSEEHRDSQEERYHDSEEEDEDDSRETNSRYRLREMKIRVYNHTVEFKRNRRLIVSLLFLHIDYETLAAFQFSCVSANNTSAAHRH